MGSIQSRAMRSAHEFLTNCVPQSNKYNYKIAFYSFVPTLNLTGTTLLVYEIIQVDSVNYANGYCLDRSDILARVEMYRECSSIRSMLKVSRPISSYCSCREENDSGNEYVTFYL